MMRAKTIILIMLGLLLVAAVMDIEMNGFEVFRNFIDKTQPRNELDFYQITNDTPRSNGNDQLSIDVSREKSLTINNPFGTIQIEGTDSDELSIRTTYTVFAESDERASEYADELKLHNKTRENGEILINLGVESKLAKGIKGIKADYIIKVPAHFSLNLEGHGLIKVDNIEGTVSVKNIYGQVQVKNIGSNLTIVQNSGWAKIENVNGDVSLRSSYGDIFISDVKGNVTFDSKGAKVNLSNITGSINGDTSYGMIEGKDIGGNATIMARMAPIRLQGVKGAIRAETEYGEVDLQDISNDVNAKIRQGQIRIKSTLNHQIQAVANNGNILTNLPGHKVNKDGTHQETMNFVAGEGKYTMVLESHFGSIMID